MAPFPKPGYYIIYRTAEPKKFRTVKYEDVPPDAYQEMWTAFGWSVLPFNASAYALYKIAGTTQRSEPIPKRPRLGNTVDMRSTGIGWGGFRGA